MHRSTTFSLWSDVLPDWLCDGIIESGLDLEQAIIKRFEEESIEVEETPVVPFWEPKHWINGIVFHYAKMTNESIWKSTVSKAQGTQLVKLDVDNGHSSEWRCDEYDEPFGSESPPMWQGLARKVTVMINLSSPEEHQGGNLILQNADGTEVDETQELEGFSRRGAIVVFPSYISYRFTPIDSGIRCMTTSWILGRPYT